MFCPVAARSRHSFSNFFFNFLPHHFFHLVNAAVLALLHCQQGRQGLSFHSASVIDAWLLSGLNNLPAQCDASAAWFFGGAAVFPLICFSEKDQWQSLFSFLVEVMKKWIVQLLRLSMTAGDVCGFFHESKTSLLSIVFVQSFHVDRSGHQ